MHETEAIQLLQLWRLLSFHASNFYPYSESRSCKPNQADFQIIESLYNEKDIINMQKKNQIVFRGFAGSLQEIGTETS